MKKANKQPGTRRPAVGRPAVGRFALRPDRGTTDRGSTDRNAKTRGNARTRVNAIPGAVSGDSIIGIGIDHAEPARLKAAIAGHGNRFLERIFTSREIAYCRRFKRRPEERYAARWAAKEAAAKALGLGIADGIRWTEFEVVNAKSGAPSLRVTGRAAAQAQKAGIDRWLLSITHTEHLATAIVLALA